MRISDLSTFDSKPILLSQLDELLNNKNVTILGNSVNVASGLVLLDDKGKIPEDVNIQHIFYIDGEFPTTDIVKNSIYVSSTGEARATNNNAEYINISLKVVTDFSAVDDETVATSKAVKTYVDEAVAGAATGTSGILSSYATIEYVDNAVASASGDQHIFYVDEFPATGVAVANSLYVKKGTKEAQIFDGTAYASISLETVEDFTTVSNDTLATTQAISSFVDDKIAAIDIPDPDLSAYQPISGMTEYAKKSEIPEEVIYVDEFPASGVAGTIYVNAEGESKLWNGTEYISLSREVVDEILSGDTNSVNVPSVKAVINYVSSNTPTLPDNITTQGNDFNTGNKLVQLVDGKIPETLYDRDVQHIFYVDAFPTSGVENSIYINSATKETRFYTGTEFIPISLKVVTDLTLATNDTVATTQAISSFVDTKIAAIDIPSTDLSNYYNKTESDNKFALKTDIASSLNVTTVDNFPTSGTNNTMYIDSQNHAQVFVNGAWKDISLEVVEDFTTVDNITVPTTKAVKDYVDANKGETIDLTNYVSTGAINLTTAKESAITLKADAQAEGFETTFSIGSGVGPTSDLGAYLKLGSGGHFSIVDGYSFHVGSMNGQFNTISLNSNSLLFNGNEYNTANGLVVLNSNGKLPSSLYDAGLSTITIGQGLAGDGTTSEPLSVVLANYSSQANISLKSTGGSINLSTTGGGSITFSEEFGSSFSVQERGIVISTQADIILNEHASNTANGLAVVGNDGKLPTSIVPVVDTQHIFQVESIPASGVNNSLYVEKDSGKVQGYFGGAFQDVSLECVDVIDDSASTTTVPSTKAVKDLVDGIAAGPAMKTEAVTKDIVFKKDVSVYKIELSAATTFTFDVSNLDEANCYTFELWVQMSTAQTLTFPSSSAWLDGTTPDISEAGMYCFVIRKMPATMVTSTITSPQILMNLAYKYSFTLA